MTNIPEHFAAVDCLSIKTVDSLLLQWEVVFSHKFTILAPKLQIQTFLISLYILFSRYSLRKKNRIPAFFFRKKRAHLDFSPKINASRIFKIGSLRKTHN